MPNTTRSSSGNLNLTGHHRKDPVALAVRGKKKPWANLFQF